jgi:putative chitinase
MITPELLQKCLGLNGAQAKIWSAVLGYVCLKFEINTPKRQAAFLAQVVVESESFTHLSENLNYSEIGLLTTFKKYFTKVEAAKYAKNKVAIANRVYASRFGNGPEESGDGWKYRGRGLIQITFHDNYLDCGLGLGVDLLNNPELLETPNLAASSAAWYWKKHGCNALADTDDFRSITKVINGGLNDEDQRESFWGKIRQEMKI